MNLFLVRPKVENFTKRRVHMKLEIHYLFIFESSNCVRGGWGKNSHISTQFFSFRASFSPIFDSLDWLFFFLQIFH
jgi:hypothetical protein